MCKRSFYCEFKVSNFTWWTKIHSFILPKRKGAKKTNNDLQTTTQKPVYIYIYMIKSVSVL